MKGDEREAAPGLQGVTAFGGLTPSEPTRVLGRFELLRPIGSGAMGRVFEALDRERGERVALKTLHKLDPSALYRLKNEFRSVADLNHRNLVALHELISHRGEWLLTMEYIDGVSFVDHLRGDRREGPGRARDALRQLALGLSALHRAGKIHGDVKSSNVLVDGSGRLVLLDFGLAADTRGDDREGTYDEGILGTPAYMSPEQAAGAPPSAASDWYAVGVMLYEALSGALPYDGSTLQILAAKQHGDPRPLAAVVDDVPADLAAICDALLERDPARRLGGVGLLARLDDAAAPPTADLRRAPHFVGRDELLRQLHAAYQASARGEPVSVYVHGPSGIGKTALIDRFIDELRAAGDVVVLEGRCYERESVPYKAFDSLIDDLSTYLRGLPGAEAAALLPRDIHALVRVFPVLERVPMVLEAPRRALESPDQQETRRRAFRALRELLARIADRHPLVLSIGDMQWGDEDSARLLADLLAPPEPPALLFVGVYRSDEASAPPMLAELRRLYNQPTRRGDTRHLAVGPLIPSEAQALALALLGRDDPPARALAATIARESDGSPLFVEELARQVRSSVDGPELGAVDVSIEAVVRARLRVLDPPARRLLELVAIGGRPLRRALVARAAALGDALGPALTQLQALHMLRSRGRRDNDLVECYHDRIRETIVAGISPKRRRLHHSALAIALEVEGDQDHEILAHHFHGAGERERAAHYAAKAAERAASTLAFNRAADLYRRARDWLGPATAHSQALLILHAEALAQAGRCGEAAPLYVQAADASPTVAAVELRRRAAEHFLVSGRIDEGITILRPLLARVELSYPETPRRANLTILSRQMQLGIRGVDFKERDEALCDAHELRRVDACWSACKGLGFVDPIRGYAFALRGLVLALKIGEPRRVIRGLATVGMLMMSRGSAQGVERGAGLVRQAEALALRRAEPYLIGLTSVIDGIASVTLGRWRQALERLDAGVQTLHDRCTGIAWESGVAQMGTMRSLLSMGRLRELSVRARAWQREAEDAGDLSSEVWAALFGSYARVADGHPDEARERVRAAIGRWSHAGFYFQHMLALAVETYCDLAQGRSMAAHNRLERIWPQVEESQILGWLFLRIFGLQIRASAALSAAAVAPREAPRLRAAAESAATELERHAGRRPDGVAAVLTIRAGIAASRGARDEARRHLEGALAGYEASDMELHAACIRRRKGLVIGGEEGRRWIDEADAALRGQEIAEPARWTAILVPGFEAFDEPPPA
ncbi:MAG: AAA family ATPase [Nannocystaceae bacterium]